jgi:MFS family permease
LLDRNLSSASQAGLVNNLNDGMAWGLFPLLFAAAGMSLGQIGTLAAIYPAVWGLGQLFTGAWSDRIGRKGLIVSGMWVQALAIGVIAVSESFSGFAVGAVLLGAGTAMVYPTLLAVIGDVAHPTWRASSVGVYRLWRDLGYAVGALLAGAVADAFGLAVATWTIAVLTFASGGLAAFRMRETLVRDTEPSEVASSGSEPESLEGKTDGGGGRSEHAAVQLRAPNVARSARPAGSPLDARGEKRAGPEHQRIPCGCCQPPVASTSP